ncbi:S41 family peptidase [Subsaximicrobium wynnwilliamsii]|uniref:S41 family peptidase n=1 Tax=Subsaximicrobium wynnwilliamsii TaxID=291179 RepID=A0A5C6ZEB7_9FLAO|nr:S41 family peptidase [Subsaximicrobium wynnwilliamsii]TXD82644.1 S41 family peptidase [Subsaximicrobium wynnwilliamsii]TXD88379.1 S41 family peptidase [Subsaximicrobium wynnwilliamsii]TXE02306.1 S41 family peptidase [Subsaximicrobium wynnwilliamsii]
MKTLLKKRVIVPILAICIFTTTSAFKGDFFEIAKQIEIFTTLFKELNMNYVDETNPGDLMDTAIKSMLNDLDPYTNYYNEQDVEKARINNAGDYTGIGANVLTLKDKLVIMEPYKGYAADKAGMKAGDEIIKVDNVAVGDFKEDAGNLLQGGAGTSVTVTYIRQGETKSTTIQREAVDIHAVPHYSMVNENIGYVVLRKFNEKTSSETISAIRALKNLGAKKLILDLRGNPGGLLSEAVNVTNIFVPKNQLVVTTKSKVEKYNKTYYTQKDPIDTEIPLVVLIDGRSASASEIVSGALQDLDRAVVVGARSFGKGLVQRPKKLVYGTQMKITISRYYTPSGRSIQALDYWNRDENGKATRIRQENYNEFKTKKGRIVFDGGGIQPDLELDETKLSPITKAIIEENLIFKYATDYYYNNEVSDLDSFELNAGDFKAFKSYLSKNDFDFETETEKAFADAFEIAKDEQIGSEINTDYNALITALNTYKDKAVDDNKAQLLSMITDEIVKRYFYREGLYTYYVAHNFEIQKAVEILKNPSNYLNYLN